MAWDSTKPTGTTKISASDEIIQQNFQAIERGNVTSARKVRIDSRDALSLSSDPTNVTDVGYIYSKDVNSKTELHYIDEDGNVTQITNAGSLYGTVVQVQRTRDTAVASTSSQIPFDATIPQNTEGTELTTLSITPKDTANRLIIEFYCPLVAANASGELPIFALFQDSTADALQASACAVSSVKQGICQLRYEMAAGTTSSTTFKIRYGTSGSSAVYVNQTATGNFFSTATQWNFTITEIL